VEEPVVEAERPAVEKKEEVKFFIRKITLTGNDLIPEEVLRPLIAAYENRDITFGEVDTLNLALEGEFRRQGYFAVVYAPPQKLENQTLTLQVVISRLEDVHVEGARHFYPKKILTYWLIPRGEPLRYDEVRRGVDAMNANPDRLVQAIMRPGEEPGTSDIHLKVKDRNPFHIGFGYDNRGTKFSGKERPSTYIRNNNFLGLDDILMAGVIAGRNYGDAYFQYLIPLTSRGMRLAYGFTYDQSNPKKEFEELGVNGVSVNHDITLYQQIAHTGTFSADAHIGYSFKDSRTDILSATSSRDKLRVVSFGAEFRADDTSGTWTHTQDFYFGLGLYGDDDDNVLTSRQAGSSYFKYVASFGRNQTLPWGFGLNAESQVQLTPQELPSDEQWFIGGATTVRGYPESDYGADQAIVNNVELSVPALFFMPESWTLPGQKGAFKDQAQFFLFYDHGYGRIHDPASFESRTLTMQGIGLGFTFRLDKNWSARFESGWAIGDKPLTESGRWQPHFLFRADF
jgi:hemolysin activation/secretion protein